MNVQVDFIGSSQSYLIDSTITIQTIFNRLANKLNLKNQAYFGLQAFNEHELCVVWLKPSDRLMDAIKKGLRFTPVLRLYFRAHSFPAKLDELKQDLTAMHLFYKQCCERWYQGYRTDSPIEMFLLSLHMLISYGPLNAVESDVYWHKLVSVVTPYLNIGEGELPETAGKLVVQTWALLGQLSTNDAIFNYMSILSSNGYPLETVRFSVKNHKEKKPTDFEINFQGIELSEFNMEGQLERRSLPWSFIRGVSQRKQFIEVKLFDENLTVLKYRCHSQFMAKRLSTQVAGYHRVYLQDKKRPPQTVSTKLELSNPVQFFHGILFNLMALQNTVSQSRVKSFESPVKVEVEEHANKKLEKIIDRLDQWMEENQGEVSRDGPTADDMFDTVSQLYALSSAIYEKVMPIQEAQSPSLSSEIDEQFSLSFAGQTRQVEPVQEPEAHISPELNESDQEQDSQDKETEVKFESDAEDCDIAVNAEDDDDVEQHDDTMLRPEHYFSVRGTALEDSFVEQFLFQQLRNLNNHQMDRETVGSDTSQSDQSHHENLSEMISEPPPVEEETQVDCFEDQMEFFATEEAEASQDMGEIQVDYYEDEQMEFFATEDQQQEEASQEVGDQVNLKEEFTLLRDLKDIIENELSQEQIADPDQLLDKAVVIDEGEIKVAIKPKNTLRRRFAKLRLSLFEH